jgi:Nuclease-related domain
MSGDTARATAPREVPREVPRETPRHRAKAEAVVLEPAVFEGGATGEESTAQALATLPELDWRIFHDVHWPGHRYANIDHVVVGPGGVFVIDSKAWAGDVEVAEGVLRHNGHRRERHVLAAVDAAAAVADLLPGLDPSTVKPVLCFDRDQPVFGWSREVMVCSTVNVATLLTSRATVLDDATLHLTAETLAQSLRAATDPIMPIPPKRQVPKDRRAHAAKRHQNLTRSVVTILALALLAFVVLEVVLPRLASVVEDRARERSAPTMALGETATVKGNPVRPELRLSVDRLRPTHAVGAKPGARPPVQLMAANVTIRNVGQQGWTSARGTTFELVDRSDFNHPRSTGGAKVAAGRKLPLLIKVKAGQTKRGIVVFDVPRGVRPESVRISVGPGLPKAVRWSVD